MTRPSSLMLLFVTVCAVALPSSRGGAADSKDATQATKAANAAVLDQLPFFDREDFENARKGRIARLQKMVVRDWLQIDVADLGGLFDGFRRLVTQHDIECANANDIATF